MIFERDRLEVGRKRYSLQNATVFREEEHPRADDGKFGKGGGGGSVGVETEKLTEKQKDQIKSKEFKDWFGDSKIVDESGEPLIVYKGMMKKDWRTGKDIDEFKSKNGPWAGFFSSDKKVAERFKKTFSSMGEAVVHEVYLKMSDFETIDAKGRPAKEFMIDNLKKEERNQEVADAFERSKDGIVIKGTSDEGDIFVPKNPNQIKSATDNTGAFDPNDNKFANAKGIRVYRASR